MSSAALSSVTRRHDLSADGPSSAVPESLLAELQSVSERVAKVVSEESHKLALERVALEAEKAKQAERLAEQQFALRRDHHALTAGQLELRRVAETAAAVGGYQHQRIRLMVGTTPFTAAAPTLCERAPNSVLAQLVKGRLAEHERDHGHEAGVGGAASEPIEIFVDREPSVVHWLLRWLHRRVEVPRSSALEQPRVRLAARGRSASPRTARPGCCPLPATTVGARAGRLASNAADPPAFESRRAFGSRRAGSAKGRRRWPRCRSTRCGCCSRRLGTGGWASWP